MSSEEFIETVVEIIALFVIIAVLYFFGLLGWMAELIV